MKFDLRLKSIAVFLLLLANFSSISQLVSFNKVSLPINISENVAGMVQDRNGYLWISTSKGLLRYDGYEYKVYLNEPANPNSLGENHGEMVYADRQGIIWIANWTLGMDRLDPATGKFIHFRHDPRDSASLSDDYVRAILEDHDGNLWIGTHGGLDRYETKTGKFIHYRNDRNDTTSISCNRVRAIYEDREGTLWIGTGSPWSGENNGGETDEGGLNRMDKKTGKFTRYLHDPANPLSLANNKVRVIFEDSKGVFWIGTAGQGLHTMNRKAGTFERYPYDPIRPEKLSQPKPLTDQIGPEHITFITEDVLGRIWIGTLNSGINIFDRNTNKVTHYYLDDSSASKTSWAACITRDGNLFLSSFLPGFYRTEPHRQDILFFDIGSEVNAVLAESSNNIWIGTSKGLFRKDQTTGEIKEFIHEPPYSKNQRSNSILSLYKDRSGTIYIGTNSGLDRVDQNSNKIVRIHSSDEELNKIFNSPVYGILAAGQDSIWIASRDTIYLIDHKGNSTNSLLNIRNDSKSMKINNLRTLQTDHAGNLWIGTFLGGLMHLDLHTGKVKHYLTNATNINTIFQDGGGIVWVGTDIGLYKFDYADSNFSKFTNAGNNIESSNIIGLAEDSQKNLLARSPDEIFRINRMNYQTSAIRLNSGTNYTAFTSLPIFKGANGELLLGAMNGYYLIEPDQLAINQKPPEIVFRDFSINGKSVFPGSNSPLTVPIENSDSISLAHDQNNITLHFAGIHYSNPEYNQHLYMLQNHDDSWQTGNPDKGVSYFSLPPGNYIFKVKAANSDGVWAERDLKITINPPWWRRWWAYCLYAIVLAATIFLFDRVQRRRIISKEREKTRAREMEQAQEIEKAYHELKATQTQLIQSEKMASLGELTAGIAHEIQNPLNFVNNFSEVNSELIDEMNKEIESGNIPAIKTIAGDLKTNTEKITNHGRRADAIVKSMLQHSRTSIGQKELTDINALADEYLRLAYHGLRAKDQTINAQIKMDFDNKIGKVNIVPQDIGRVLLNLYNNAFYAVTEKKKGAPHGYEPTVSVTTRKIGEKIEIQVADNGNGIPPKIADKIFQPFFTSKPTGQGTGLGLSLSYDIIKAHGGEIKVETEEGKGAEFIVQLPLH